MNKQELINMPLGTKIILDNGNELIKTGRNNFENDRSIYSIESLTDGLYYEDDYEHFRIIEVLKPTAYGCVYEYNSGKIEKLPIIEDFITITDISKAMIDLDEKINEIIDEINKIIGDDKE